MAKHFHVKLLFNTKYLNVKIRIFILVVVIILSFTQGQLLSQNQSILLPFSGDTYSPTGSKMLNFANTLNPVVESLPKHPFSCWYDDIYYPEGNPHNEDHLANADPLMIEKYLGQHPMYAQSVVHDKDGNLLFFIVDNNIYNRYGEA